MPSHAYRRLLHPHRVQRSARQDEQDLSVAAQQSRRPLGHLDGPDPLTGRGVHQDLAGRDVHVTVGIRRHALAAILGKQFYVGQSSAFVHNARVSLQLALIGHLGRLAGLRPVQGKRPQKTRPRFM